MSSETVIDGCSICYEPFTSTSEHRIASLKCGHIFGKKCIDAWLSSYESGQRCPSCNQKASSQDIRIIFGKSIASTDAIENGLEQAKRKLEAERNLLLKYAADVEELQLKYSLCESKLDQAKREIECQREVNSVLKARWNDERLCTLAAKQPFILLKKLDLETTGCRKILFVKSLNCLIITQPYINFQGFGIRIINLIDFKSDFLKVHQLIINEIALHPTKPHLLTCSQDKSVNVIDLSNKSLMATFNIQQTPCSIAWNDMQSNLFYVGLNKGDILECCTSTKNVIRRINIFHNTPVKVIRFVEHNEKTNQFILLATNEKPFIVRIASTQNTTQSIRPSANGNALSPSTNNTVQNSANSTQSETTVYSFESLLLANTVQTQPDSTNDSVEVQLSSTTQSNEPAITTESTEPSILVDTTVQNSANSTQSETTVYSIESALLANTVQTQHDSTNDSVEVQLSTTTQSIEPEILVNTTVQNSENSTQSETAVEFLPLNNTTGTQPSTSTLTSESPAPPVKSAHQFQLISVENVISKEKLKIHGQMISASKILRINHSGNTGIALFVVRPNPNIMPNNVQNLVVNFRANDNQIKNSVFRKYLVGHPNEHLVKAKIFKHPVDKSSFLLCTSDKHGEDICIYHAKDEKPIARLEVDNLVYDVEIFNKPFTNQTILTLMTGRYLYMYSILSQIFKPNIG